MDKDPKDSDLRAAVLASDYDGMREALVRGADVDGWDHLGMTPLLWAVYRGDAEAVQLLLSSGANPNRPQKGDPTATPLWHAPEDFGLEKIAALLRAFGAQPSTKGLFSRCARIFAGRRRHEKS